MIEPTVGRVVLYRDDTMAFGEWLAAIVVKVWGPRMVNLAVFTDMGAVRSETSVTLRQPEDETLGGRWCEWMPYQVGQAAKTEQVAGGLMERVAALEAEVRELRAVIS